MLNKMKHKIDLEVVAGVILMIIVLLILISIAVILIKEDSKNDTIKNQLEIIQGGYRQAVLYDRDINVMYLWDYRGGYTVMVDADGDPLLYEGE